MNTDSFFQLTLDEFLSGYPDEESCILLLEKLKWGNGFQCRKCGHHHYCDGKYPGSRRCTRCKTEETLKAHTIFQNCKLPLHTSMHMMLYAYHRPLSSTSVMCRELGIRQMTCWRMKQLVRDIMKEKK